MVGGWADNFVNIIFESLELPSRSSGNCGSILSASYSDFSPAPSHHNLHKSSISPQQNTINMKRQHAPLLSTQASSAGSNNSFSASKTSLTDVKLRRIADSISNRQDDSGQYGIEDVRLKTKEFLAHSIIGELYNNIMLLISIFSSFHYIYNTYRDDGDEKDFMELGIAIIFTLDWCLSCFLADHKVLFFTRYVDCYNFYDQCLNYSPPVSIPWLT